MLAVVPPENRVRHRSPRSSAAVLTAVLGTLAGCGAGPPARRGFDSREVLPVRDPTLMFSGYGPNVLHYSTSDGSAKTAWSLDLTTGEATVQARPDGGSGPLGGYECELDATGGPGSGHLTVTNVETSEQESFDGVVAVVRCPSNSDPTLVVVRSDSTGGLTLWNGLPDDQRQVPLPLTIDRLAFSDTGRLVVLSRADAQSTALSLFSIDLSIFTAVEVVPAALGSSAWAIGATPAGSLASDSLAIPGNPPSNTIAWPVGSHYAYERTMTDGSTTMFVGPFASATTSEVALFPLAPTGKLVDVPSAYFPGALPADEPQHLVAWQYGDPSTKQASFFLWDDGRGAFTACPLPATLASTNIGTSDGTRVLYGATTPDAPNWGVSHGPLLLVSFAASAQDPATCALIASSDVTTAGFSSDSTLMFWLVEPNTLAAPGTGDATLWTAGADGRNARVIGRGGITQPHFTTGTRMELEIGGDLMWIDAADASNTPHYIAAQIFGTAIDVRDQWAVMGYDVSDQDGTGTLGVVNRDTGAKRFISSDVAQYQRVSDGASSDGGGSTLQIAYLVRGHNPSPLDGIWVASISPGALP